MKLGRKSIIMYILHRRRRSLFSAWSMDRFLRTGLQGWGEQGHGVRESLDQLELGDLLIEDSLPSMAQIKNSKWENAVRKSIVSEWWRMVKEVQVSGLQQRWTRASQRGFCRTQFCENLWLIKKHMLYLQFYVCTLLAFAIKDWWGSPSHNFVKGPLAPVSAFHQRNRTSRRCVWRDWLQGTGLSSWGNCLGKCEICRAGLEKGGACAEAAVQGSISPSWGKPQFCSESL